MDHESIKQRLTRFGKPQPDILSQHWQQTSQDEQQSDTALEGEQSGEIGQATHWPTLPKWPPLPEGAPPASSAWRHDLPMAPGETPATDQQLAPPWEQPDASQPKRPMRALNVLWRRFWPVPSSSAVGPCRGRRGNADLFAAGPCYARGRLPCPHTRRRTCDTCQRAH